MIMEILKQLDKQSSPTSADWETVFTDHTCGVFRRIYAAHPPITDEIKDVIEQIARKYGYNVTSFELHPDTSALLIIHWEQQNPRIKIWSAEAFVKGYPSVCSGFDEDHLPAAETLVDILKAHNMDSRWKVVLDSTTGYHLHHILYDWPAHLRVIS